MLRLPHRIIYAPRVAALTGHTGMTVYFWTFCAKRNPSARFVRHERRHVWHWLIGTVGGAAGVLALHWVFAVSLLWLLCSPLGFLAPYFLSFIPGGYRASWFEKDAERYADGVG